MRRCKGRNCEDGAPMRKICIIGGSNSIGDGGWAGQLSRRLPEGFDIVNKSVGGAPCMMGSYQVAGFDSLAPGDIVLWEYALNDQNYISFRRVDPKLLLRFCEHTIRRCQDRGVRFIPLIFATRDVSILPEMTEYRRALRALFAHYGIDFIDVTEELPRKLNRPRMPLYVFRDDYHYKPGGVAVNYTAKRVLDLIGTGAGEVRAAPRLHSAEGTSVQAINRFTGGMSATYTNRLVSETCWTPDPNGQPLEVRIDEGPFRLVGVVMLCTPLGGAFRVRVAGTGFTISATYQESGFAKPLIRFFNLADDAEVSGPYPAGSQITLEWEDQPVPVRSDSGFVRKLSPEQLMGRQSSVLGLVVEQQAGRPDSPGL